MALELNTKVLEERLQLEPVTGKAQTMADHFERPGTLIRWRSAGRLGYQNCRIAVNKEPRS